MDRKHLKSVLTNYRFQHFGPLFNLGLFKFNSRIQVMILVDHFALI